MILGWFYRPFVIIVMLVIISCGGCMTTALSRASIADAAVFVIVRHAEKATDDPKDPTLSETGHARAQQLAERLAIQRITAVYVTGYRRTQQTAEPTARAHGLEVQTYDAAMPAADFAAQLRSRHVSGSVLVVGHSNTVAAIASALCACAVSPLAEDEYDRWITVSILQNGAIKLEDAGY
jgi:phosphohistidine phosphatase SixA